MKTITEIRRAFWQNHPQFAFDYKGTKVRQNSYGVDIRVSFIDYIDSLCKDGVISENLAKRVTL